MKIGLVGVPGSGKSALAVSIKKAFENLGNSEYLPVAVVDNYVEELQNEVDLALGWAATYIGNTHVALKRETKERMAWAKNKTIVSCGTLFETSSYTGQLLQEDFDSLEKDDDAGRYDLVLRTEAVTRMLACLYADTLRYDHIFYLPPVGEITDPRITNLEKNLQAAFNAFELYPVTRLFVEGDDMLEVTENRLKVVLEEVLGANNTQKQDV
jgi:hypothetical protein